MKNLLIAVLVFSALFCVPVRSEYTADWESLKNHKAVPDWFSDVEFGVYFTWGVYSVPAELCEWYPRIMYIPNKTPEQKWWHWGYEHHRKIWGEDFHYHDFIPLWKAEKFDAVEWLDLFEETGVQFVGSIAEHHDGFSLWQSEVNEWNSYDMGPKVDIVKAIADETRRRDLKFMATFHHGFHGMYYPKPDNTVIRPMSPHNESLYNCEVPQDEKYKKLYGNYTYEEMNELWLAKLNEVVEAHCPDYIWFDFGQRFIQEEYRQQFLANYFNKAAELGKEVAVNTKQTYFFPKETAMVNVELATMAEMRDEVWITDFILGSYWSYNKNHRTAMDPGFAIRLLADVVSKNGVMLLCAGPKPDGTFPEEQVDAMKKIGAWLKLYGEAIYQTEPFTVYGEGPTHFTPDKEYGAVMKGLDQLYEADVRYTRKGDDTVYAIQLGWCEEETSKTLEAFAVDKGLKVKSVAVLGSDEKIDWMQAEEGLTVNQPKQQPAKADMAMVYKITLQ